MKQKKSNSELVSNRKARHDYEVLETLEAGIVLLGTEIKSLKNHEGNLRDAYITIKKEEAWLINSFISPYSHGNLHNHKEKRDRKLLLNKHEISKLQKMTQEKGLTLVPLAIYLKKGKAKVQVAVVKGKKHHDKRESLKEKQHQREIQRELKKFA